MIRQDDPRLNVFDPTFARNGCTVMCCHWAANKYLNTELTPRRIFRNAKRWIRNGWLTEDLYVVYWGAIMIDLNLNVTYLGHLSPDYIPGADEFEFLKFVNGQVEHFAAGSGDGNNVVTYDPLGRSVTVANGHVINKRVFRFNRR